MPRWIPPFYFYVRRVAFFCRDFVIMCLCASPRNLDEDVSLTLSPVIVGSALTIVIISLAVALRIFVVTFLNNMRRNSSQGPKATATAVVSQTGEVYKVGRLWLTAIPRTIITVIPTNQFELCTMTAHLKCIPLWNRKNILCEICNLFLHILLANTFASMGNGVLLKSGSSLEKPRWQHTDIQSKSSEDLVEDERDPDVIPSQYGKLLK